MKNLLIGSVLLCVSVAHAAELQQQMCQMQGQLAATSLLGRALGKSQTEAMQVVMQATEGVAQPWPQDVLRLLLTEVVDGVYQMDVSALENNPTAAIAHSQDLGQQVQQNCLKMDIRRYFPTQ